MPVARRRKKKKDKTRNGALCLDFDSVWTWVESFARSREWVGWEVAASRNARRWHRKWSLGTRVRSFPAFRRISISFRSRNVFTENRCNWNRRRNDSKYRNSLEFSFWCLVINSTLWRLIYAIEIFTIRSRSSLRKFSWMDVIIVWLIKAQDSTLTCLAVLKMKMFLGVQLVVVLIVDINRHAIIGACKVPEF